MDSGRGYRGWVAALTVAISLTLVLLAVEKHLRIPTIGYRTAPNSSTTAGATTADRGILLTVDPGLARTQHFAQADQIPLSRRTDNLENTSALGLLRRPPEPAANVILQAPIVTLELDRLPLHATRSNIENLMETMDRALESPMHIVSASRPNAGVPSFSLNPTFPSEGGSNLQSPASIAGRIPEPSQLFAELADLAAMVDVGSTSLVNTRRPRPFEAQISPLTASSVEANAVITWVSQTKALLQDLVSEHGLEHPASAHDLKGLTQLAAQADQLGNALADHALASYLIRAGYSLQRRVALWTAIQGCLDGTSIGLSSPRTHDLARQELITSLQNVEVLLGTTGDAENWKTYLMLDELRAWATSDRDIWEIGNVLTHKVLSRIQWQRLSAAQQRFLAQPQFVELTSLLIVWGREPIDYRQLLTNLEQFEEASTGRANAALAGTVQILRHSDHPSQRLVAQVLNDHYRNANMRLAISAELLERFTPNSQSEIRPVRQRILGADTSGDSAIDTHISIKLIPDETAWNLDLGVVGDLVSMTSSSKGPAVFHNTSTAQINSHRYVRIDPTGYQVSSQPTGVYSQDYLRRMSTDFDQLPVIGDFVRLIVREQFEQKRGLAQRITRRLIAQEADAELDRRLEQGLSDAERELKSRIVGPLENFKLNPIVVSMSTTEDRLTVRYRVAHENQMAAFTPRPRAPADALMSLQFHQSMLNNAIDQIGLSGRDWSLPELYQRLGEVFQQSGWKLPTDTPTDVSDVSIRFEDHRPATVELIDGHLRLSLRVAELRQPERLHIQHFVVSANYIPIADGLKAELIKDDSIEIVATRDRFKLRVIFASIFVANKQIPLVAESWHADPRAEGLAVSQVEIRDGWLSVAISNSDSKQAAQVAERSRAIKFQ
jgi:hypothetical protein